MTTHRQAATDPAALADWNRAIEAARQEYAANPLAHCHRALCTDVGRPDYCRSHRATKKDRP